MALPLGWGFHQVTAGEGEPDDKDIPRIRVQFQDKQANRVTGPKGATLAPTMRFGVEIVKKGQPPKRLTFHSAGVSNNTCLKIDGSERLFGSKPGEWKERAVKLGTNKEGKERLGLQSIWRYPNEKILVTQLVEVVRGAKSGLLDTALVIYEIHNTDSKTHQVGIRFLLDTHLGANDGPPFLVGGQKKLIDTRADFKGAAQVPDFIQVLEKPNLKAPGTTAFLGLKLEGLEKPSRVSLCAWPNPALGHLDAEGEMTRWEVPVLDMSINKDSAAVIYWEEQELKAGAKRRVGFTYGLDTIGSVGNVGLPTLPKVPVDGTEQFGLSVTGALVPGTEFLVLALVNNPEAGLTLTLKLPPGLKLVKGEETQKVPALVKGAPTKFRPVIWKARAEQAGKYSLQVQSSTGATQTRVVVISKKKDQ
jgi:hypothetical protein